MTGISVRRGLPAAAAVTAALCALAGCGSGDDGKTTAAGSSATAPASPAGSAGAPEPAAKGGSIGATGSTCELPVTFDLPAGWEPAAVDVDPGSEFAALAQQGPLTLVCEIDAKPTGNIGFLRVWRGEKSGASPRALLEAFVTAGTGAADATYTDVRAGTVAGAEAAYTVYSDLLDGRKKESAFLVPTAQGPVVVHLGGMDSDEHDQMLPAYELAKSSLRTG